jgi:hypothetical protein
MQGAKSPSSPLNGAPLDSGSPVDTPLSGAPDAVLQLTLPAQGTLIVSRTIRVLGTCDSDRSKVLVAIGSQTKILDCSPAGTFESTLDFLGGEGNISFGLRYIDQASYQIEGSFLFNLPKPGNPTPNLPPLPSPTPLLLAPTTPTRLTSPAAGPSAETVRFAGTCDAGRGRVLVALGSRTQWVDCSPMNRFEGHFVETPLGNIQLGVRSEQASSYESTVNLLVSSSPNVASVSPTPTPSAPVVGTGYDITVFSDRQEVYAPDVCRRQDLNGKCLELAPADFLHVPIYGRCDGNTTFRAVLEARSEVSQYLFDVPINCVSGLFRATAYSATRPAYRTLTEIDIKVYVGTTFEPRLVYQKTLPIRRTGGTAPQYLSMTPFSQSSAEFDQLTDQAVLKTGTLTVRGHCMMRGTTRVPVDLYFGGQLYRGECQPDPTPNPPGVYTLPARFFEIPVRYEGPDARLFVFAVQRESEVNYNTALLIVSVDREHGLELKSIAQNHVLISRDIPISGTCRSARGDVFVAVGSRTFTVPCVNGAFSRVFRYEDSVGQETGNPHDPVRYTSVGIGIRYAAEAAYSTQLTARFGAPVR